MEWAAFCLDRWGRPTAVPAPGWLSEDDPPRADRIRHAIFNEGPVQRGQGNGGPSTPKPALVPQGISSPRSAVSSPRSDGSSPRSVTPAPLDP
jgi:hypothetical protein